MVKEPNVPIRLCPLRVALFAEFPPNAPNRLPLDWSRLLLLLLLARVCSKRQLSRRERSARVHGVVQPTVGRGAREERQGLRTAKSTVPLLEELAEHHAGAGAVATAVSGLRVAPFRLSCWCVGASRGGYAAMALALGVFVVWLRHDGIAEGRLCVRSENRLSHALNGVVRLISGLKEVGLTLDKDAAVALNLVGPTFLLDCYGYQRSIEI